MVNLCRIIVLLLLTVGIIGCALFTGTSTDFKPWQGDKVYEGDGGSVETVDGVEFWEIGSPGKPFKVIGVISQITADDIVIGALFEQYSKNSIIEIVKREGGSGIVLLKTDRFMSGSERSSKDSVMAIFRYVEP